MTKLAKTHIRAHINTFTESKSHALYSINLSLSYIQRAGPADPWTAPHIPVSAPPPPSALCASWFRPAVAALATSGADPPHLNASDIYLGRTTGGRGGGGGDDIHHRRICILRLWVSLTAPPACPLDPPCCVLHHVFRMFVLSVCMYDNKMVRSQR